MHHAGSIDRESPRHGLNLYTVIPAGDAQVSYLREIETAPGMLTAHALLALLLLATAGIMLLRAIALRDMTVIALVAAGLAALLGAFAAGEEFVKNQGTPRHFPWPS